MRPQRSTPIHADFQVIKKTITDRRSIVQFQFSHANFPGQRRSELDFRQIADDYRDLTPYYSFRALAQANSMRPLGWYRDRSKAFVQSTLDDFFAQGW